MIKFGFKLTKTNLVWCVIAESTAERLPLHTRLLHKKWIPPRSQKEGAVSQTSNSSLNKKYGPGDDANVPTTEENQLKFFFFLSVLNKFKRRKFLKTKNLLTGETEADPEMIKVDFDFTICVIESVALWINLKDRLQ